ncbi:Uncharacterised protein [Mycoplasmopsis maculosa]|uniref:Uncharacterized protein n=1 Tax=Mycoplasmopsis maculosa TaxID=114885 RepID=A0A449B3N0_9BACT|nr:hypothetical protein [Mycoplasmopsis maculosa]VEU75197.1 Uncharacterised protein [Mycoplasmopsis maculosa]
MPKKVIHNENQCIYIETFTEISIKELMLKYQNDRENEKPNNLLNSIYHDLFAKKENKNEEENDESDEFNSDAELNLKMNVSLIDERYNSKKNKAIFWKQELTNVDSVTELEEKDFIYKNIELVNKEIHHFSKFMDVFVMPNDSLMIRTSSLINYNKKVTENDLVEDFYSFNLKKAAIFSMENAKNVTGKIFKKLYKNVNFVKNEKDKFNEVLWTSLKNKTRQISIFNIDGLSEEILEELNIHEINYYSDILEFEEANIRVKATNNFKEKVAKNLLFKFINNNWDFESYYTKALVYTAWGYNYYNSCQNRLVKKKLFDTFELKNDDKDYKFIPRAFLTIYNVDLVQEFAVIPSALSINLKDKFKKLIEEIVNYKKERDLFISDKKIYNKSFRESVLALWVIIGTSLLSVSGLWQVASWMQDKWISSIDDNFKWFVFWIILVCVSGVIFASTIIYAFVKFLYSYFDFKNHKKLLKTNEENLKIIDDFYDKELISKNIIDTFNKNVLIIQDINSKNKE